MFACARNTLPVFMAVSAGRDHGIVRIEPNTVTRRKHFTCNRQKSDPPTIGNFGLNAYSRPNNGGF